jgi:hypothetical protein
VGIFFGILILGPIFFVVVVPFLIPYMILKDYSFSDSNCFCMIFKIILFPILWIFFMAGSWGAFIICGTVYLISKCVRKISTRRKAKKRMEAIIKGNKKIYQNRNY